MKKNLRVLLCEDDENIRKQMVKALQREGFDVSEAENGRIGVEKFKAELHDIVITDMRMPEMDGSEVLRRVKEISPNVQVILATGFGDLEMAIDAIRQGALDYLKKPIDLDLLLTALGRAREKIEESETEKETFPAVLLAEDDSSTRKALRQALEREGWKVFEAEDGAAAIDIFAKNKVDIVLLDINMPKKTGLETLHELRTMGIFEFEAIVLTGFGDEEKAVQALRDGAMNFLKKPVDIEHLILSMDKALEKIRDRRALKYRSREVELSRQVIARIEVEKGLVIDLQSLKNEASADFIRKVFDAIPMAFFLVDQEKKIIYSNSGLSKHFETLPKAIDASFVDDLSKIGVRELTFEKLNAVIDSLLSSEPGKFASLGGGPAPQAKNMDEIRTGPYGYMFLLALTIIEGGKRRPIVAVVVRGERK